MDQEVMYGFVVVMYGSGGDVIPPLTHTSPPDPCITP